MTHHIRAARPDELSRVAAVMRASWEYGIAPLVPGLVRRRVSAENPFESFVWTLGRRLLVADVGGQPVGAGAHDHEDGHITDLWVAPTHQGRGVGSSLLAALEARLAQAGSRTARLEVLTANVRAMALYRYRGYRPEWCALKLDRGIGVTLHKTGMVKPLRPATPR